MAQTHSATTSHRNPDPAGHTQSVVDRPSLQPQPFALSVLALLIPASILGVLARLGLLALCTYDGSSIFPLAYVQAVGCLIMGIALGLKESFGTLSVSDQRFFDRERCQWTRLVVTHLYTSH